MWRRKRPPSSRGTGPLGPPQIFGVVSPPSGSLKLCRCITTSTFPLDQDDDSEEHPPSSCVSGWLVLGVASQLGHRRSCQCTGPVGSPRSSALRITSTYHASQRPRPPPHSRTVLEYLNSRLDLLDDGHCPCTTGSYPELLLLNLLNKDVDLLWHCVATLKSLWSSEGSKELVLSCTNGTSIGSSRTALLAPSLASERSRKNTARDFVSLLERPPPLSVCCACGADTVFWIL